MPASPIKLIVGLGNPGPQYEHTRHNVGFWFVDLLAQRHGERFRAENRFHGHVCRIRIEGHDCRMLKPMTFMNRSGQALVVLAAYFGIAPEQRLVAHDELDLPAGTVRLKLGGGGHAGHNGLRDIMGRFGSRDFQRLRIGIDHPQDRSRVVDYVLSRPGSDDREAIEGALEEAAETLPELLAGEFQRVMNRLHTTR